MRSLTTLLGLLVLLASACGGGLEEVGPDTGEGADAVELGSDDAAASAPGGRVDGGAATAAAPGEEGTDVESVTAGDAGEVEVRIVDGRRLELIEVREAPGWSHAVGDRDEDEVELRFRHDDGRVLDLEMELLGGRLHVETG